MLRPDSTVTETTWYKTNVARFVELWGIASDEPNPAPFGLPMAIRVDGDEAEWKLQVVTSGFIYYGDEQESDDTSSIRMYDYGFDLVADNFLAADDFASILDGEQDQETGVIFWTSSSFKYAQEERNKERGNPETLRRQIEFLNGFCESVENSSPIDEATETTQQVLYKEVLEAWCKSEGLEPMCADDLRHTLREKLRLTDEA